MDVYFRSPLEQKWSEFFTKYGWEWTYAYEKGSPPMFWLKLPTNREVSVFVTVTHTNIRLSDRFEALKRQICLIRNRGHVQAHTAVLAVSDGPFINQEFSVESRYAAVRNWYYPNCIGYISHTVSEGPKELNQECRYVQGPVMIRKPSAQYILYWICDQTGWEYSEFKVQCKPSGYYNKVVDNLPWHATRPREKWAWSTRIHDIGTRKSNANVSSIIDRFLWKPPNGLMVRKMMEEVKHLAQSQGLWRDG